MTQTTQDKRGVLLKNAESPFYSSFKPEGSTDIPVVGGNSAFGYSAPNGIQDGKVITLTTNAFSFSTPEKFNWLGHGRGFLYDSPDGTQMTDVVVSTPLGDQTWEYEIFGARRYVATINGKKYLRSLLKPISDSSLVNCGFINFDSGRSLTPSDFTYLFSSGRLTAGSGETNDNSFQLKDDRISAYRNLPAVTDHDTDNSIYLKHYAAGNVLDGIRGHVSKEFTSAKGLNKKGQHYSQGWVWKQNTPDIADGYNIVHAVQDGGVGYSKVESYRTSESLYARTMILSESTERPRWLKWQGYLGNTAPEHSNIEWLKTDMFAQLNGSIFILADSNVLSSCTNFHPLVPVTFNSSTSWTLRLWRGMLADYTNAYIHLLDSSLNSVASVKL